VERSTPLPRPDVPPHLPTRTLARSPGRHQAGGTAPRPNHSAARRQLSPSTSRSLGRCPVTPEQHDPIRAAAQLLARHGTPGIGRQLRIEHAADASGHCPACRQAASGVAPVWPCRLAAIAELVEQLNAAAPHADSP
jgi:hypothetical protein